MPKDHWQLQEAKQRFSELVRAVLDEGPQFVTRHGKEVVVIVDVDDFKRAQGDRPDFKQFLVSAPDIDQLDVKRERARAPRVNLTAT